jgi:hypothetical protein
MVFKDISGMTWWQWLIILPVAIAGGYRRYSVGKDNDDDNTPTKLF